MGITYTTVEILNLSGNPPGYTASFLVDTGAIDCIVSSKTLGQAGIKKEGESVYELADGSVVKYPFGFARIRFMGAETVTQVVFGPDDCEPILGVVALENTGFGVDPITKTLKKMTAKPLK